MTLRAAALLVLAILCVHAPARADSGDDVVHIVGPGSVSRTPVTTDAMWRKIRAAAEKYREYAPVPRYARYDITYPANADEYRALDGYGLLLVTVVTQDSGEVPLARVYLSGAESSHTFSLVSSFRSPVADPAVSSVLGATRFDALYLFPMQLRHESGKLTADFARNRSGFVLGELPLGSPGDDPLPTDPPSAAQPPPEALAKLVARELPMFLEGAP